MKLGINGATTMPYSLEEDIAAASLAGFTSIEIWYKKLVAYLENHSLEELKEVISASCLEVATLCPTFIKAFSQQKESLNEIRKAAEIASKLGCRTILACPDRPAEGITRWDAIEMFSRTAKEAVQIAEDYGVQIALEPLGRHPFLDGCTPALEVIDRVNSDSLGLMLDTFHYYKSEVTIDEINRIPVEKVFIIHINDCDDLPKTKLQDKDRLYPTLGVIPAVEMVRPLVVKGYSGTLSVEVFRPQYWEAPIDEINRIAFQTGTQFLHQLKHPN